MLGAAMRPGVVGLLPGDPGQITEAHARSVRQHGFTGVSVFQRRPLEVAPADLEHARDVLAAQGVRIAQANADYPGLVSRDPAQRAEGIRQAQAAVRGAKRMNAIFQYIRPGSMSSSGHWRPHRENHTQETFDRLVDSLKQVSRFAEDEGMLLGLEGHVVSTLDTPRRVREVIEAVGSPALRFNVDPVNFVGNLTDAYSSARIVESLFEELGPYVICAHVKDFKIGERLVLHIDECVPGEGIFDQIAFVRAFEAHSPDAFALIEHLPDDKIPQAKVAVDRALEAAGVTWKID
jgi:sugar phosphate isomerase/epimerase